MMKPPNIISIRSFATLARRSSFVTPNVVELIRDNTLGVGKSPQKIKEGKPNILAGKVVTFDKAGKSEILDSTDISNHFSIVLSCGLGGGGSEKSLFESYEPISHLLYKDEVAVYSSLRDSEGRQERFRKGLPYYYDESYVNEEESQNFFKQVLEKRFFTDGKLKDPRKVQNLLLVGFSIGHRENISHINFLYDKIAQSLDKEGKNPSLIQRYFEKVAVVNIGSPVNWRGKKVSKEILTAVEQGTIDLGDITEKDYTDFGDAEVRRLDRISVLNIRSVMDMGTAKPEADFNNFHCNSLLYRPEIFKSVRLGRNESMYIFGAGKVKELYFDKSDVLKHNFLGHGLESYAKAIHDSTSTTKTILSLLSSPRYDLSLPESDVLYLPYDQNRRPSLEDTKILEEAWAGELQIREVMRSRSRAKENSNDVSNSR